MSSIIEYFQSIDTQFVLSTGRLLLEGALVTLQITLVAVSCGVLIGLFVGVAELSSYRILRIPAKIYVDIIRGTPLLVQIFIIYFALPAIIGMRIEPYIAAVVACSINSGAYVAEIFRAGIQSIDKGQFEGARANGLSNLQTMFYIVLPQAYKKMIPPIISQLISLVKDTSLAMGIVLSEMTYRGQIIYAQNSTYIIPVLIVITLIYFLLNYGLSLIARWFDSKLA